jgi:hypothetical protein
MSSSFDDPCIGEPGAAAGEVDGAHRGRLEDEQARLVLRHMDRADEAHLGAFARQRLGGAAGALAGREIAGGQFHDVTRHGRHDPRRR